VKVRQARDGDVPSIAEIHVRSWRAAYRGILSDELLDGLSVSERETSDPSQWRLGAGRAMPMAALGELSRRHYRDVILWVLPENRPALGFYDRFGFEVEEGVEKREERSGRPVIRLRASLPPASSS
jgi:GNAT superfamily N-acetyltransferase